MKILNLKLILPYLRNGQFLFLIFFILLNGFDKNSLKLARIAAQNKQKKKLGRKYKRVIHEKNCDLKPMIASTTLPIWFCWLQGLDNAPEVVKKCYQNLLKNTNRPVIVITEKNFHEYTQIPSFILKKVDKGIITNTHFSDLLRAELLARNGGTWIDATVLLVDSIPVIIENSELFFFQKCQPGSDGNGVFISSWFIHAKPNNSIILLTRSLLFSYWEKKNYLVDYFLFHIFFCIACDEYVNEYNLVLKLDNSAPHQLLLKFDEKYCAESFNWQMKNAWLHKLTYKVSDEIKNDKENVYNQILKSENIERNAERVIV